jgi:hypothetical protein
MISMTDQTPESGTIPEPTDTEPAEQSVADTEQHMVPLDSEHADPVPGREAAKWRKQLREVEAQRDSLVGTVQALQRAQVDAAVAATGLKPAALWASGAQLSDLVADDGTPDQAKITAAVAAAREQLGIDNDRRPKTPARGLTSGATSPRPEPVNKWREAFAPPSNRG